MPGTKAEEVQEVSSVQCSSVTDQPDENKSQILNSQNENEDPAEARIWPRESQEGVGFFSVFRGKQIVDFKLN